MSVFKLNAVVTVSAFTVVVADSLEQAIEISKNRTASLAGGGILPTESWVIEDADGLPQDIRAD